MTNIEMMKRHLAVPEEIDLGDGDTVSMAPLSLVDLPDLIEAQAQMYEKITSNSLGKIFNLIKKSLIAADAGVGNDPELLDRFVNKNLKVLMAKMMEINSLLTEGDKERIESVDKIKKKIDNVKSASRTNSQEKG